MTPGPFRKLKKTGDLVYVYEPGFNSWPDYIYFAPVKEGDGIRRRHTADGTVVELPEGWVFDKGHKLSSTVKGRWHKVMEAV